MSHNEQTSLTDMRAEVNFWEIFGGGFFTGLTALSVYDHYARSGLKGVVRLTLEKYQWARELMFAQLQWDITPPVKDLVILASLFLAVTVRAYFAMRDSRPAAKVGGILLGTVLSFYCALLAAFGVSAVAEGSARQSTIYVVIGALIICAMLYNWPGEDRRRALVFLAAMSSMAFWMSALLTLSALS